MHLELLILVLGVWALFATGAAWRRGRQLRKAKGKILDLGYDMSQLQDSAESQKVSLSLECANAKDLKEKAALFDTRLKAQIENNKTLLAAKEVLEKKLVTLAKEQGSWESSQKELANTMIELQREVIKRKNLEDEVDDLKRSNSALKGHLTRLKTKGEPVVA